MQDSADRLRTKRVAKSVVVVVVVAAEQAAAAVVVAVGMVRVRAVGMVRIRAMVESVRVGKSSGSGGGHQKTQHQQNTC